MAFLDLFRKKKKKTERMERKKPVKKPAKVRVAPKKKKEQKLVEKKPAVGKKPALPKKHKGAIKVAPNVLREPQITEKATLLQDENQYVFKTQSNVSKPEIKKAVEEVYGVDVVKVRTINIPRQRRRLGRTMGWKQGYKKAIVSLRQGQSIEVLPR